MRASRWIFGTAAGLALAACAPAPAPVGHTHRVEQEVRPTDGEGWQQNGYDEGVEAYSYDSPAGYYRVWYVLESDDAISSVDDDESGVPDYAEQVGALADQVWETLIVEGGFRAPLSDEDYHDRADYGGDARFDIYLKQLEHNDGYRVVEACTEVPLQCAGYLVMENDFRFFHYDTVELGIKTLTSHEFMHAVLDAYDADLPQYVSEGVATWSEEFVYPEQDDFEGFLPYFFDELDRPLNEVHPGDMTDLFPYGAAIWIKYLEEALGLEGLLAILEGMEDTAGLDPEFLDVVDEVGASYGTDLSSLFVEFALWNAATGSGAGTFADRGYANAASYPGVTWQAERVEGGVLTVDATLDRLSSAYFSSAFSELANEEVRVQATGRLRYAVYVVVDGEAVTEPIVLAPAGALDRATLTLPARGLIRMVAINAGQDRGDLDGTLTIEVIEQDPEPEEDTGVGEDTGMDVGSDTTADTGVTTPTSGGDDGGCSTMPSGASPAWWLVGVGLLWRRRRRANQR